MSLINDALRRASQTEKERPAATRAPIGMEPVAFEKKAATNRFLAVVILIILVLAVLLFWRWWNVRSKPAEVLPVAVVQPVPAPKPPVVVPKPALVAVAATVSKPAPVPAVVPAPAPVVAPTPAPVAAVPVAAEAPVTWPVELKVSAIFYSLHHPRVIINGGVYGVGDTIQDITIKNIEKNKVTVEWNHHAKDLLLDGQ